jgi:hypothetical protein
MLTGRSCADLPFDFHDGLIWVRVNTAQVAEPLNFILDSGASVSVLDIQTANRLGLRKGERVLVNGVGAQVEGYWPQRLPARLDNVTLPKDYLAVDLGSLGKACGRRLDGLLGADFFQGKIVQIDYATQRLRLLPKDSRPQGGELLPLKRCRGTMHVPVRVNSHTQQWVRLDTGCATALHWVSHCTPSDQNSHRVSIGLAGVETPIVVANVQLGRHDLGTMPIGVHSRELFPGEAGLLGNGILSRFRVTIDSVHQRLILEANGSK